MFFVQSTNEEKVLIVLNPTTAAGNPAIVDGAPVWTLNDGDATLEVAADGMSAYLVSGTPLVNAVNVTADADLGEGVRSISEDITYNVVAAEAAALGISSSVEPK